jgi:diguanylate cyclase (GGDEF)-like protein
MEIHAQAVAGLSGAGLWACVGVVCAGLLAVWAGMQWRSSRRLRLRLEAARPEIGKLRARDPLTGLLSRVEFEMCLDAAVLACDRGAAPMSLLCVGLDNFRAINDGYGDRVGDFVLVEVATRLSRIARTRAQISRLGNDEFGILISSGQDKGSGLSAEALEALQQPYGVDGLDLRLTASVGIATYPDHGSRPRLMSHAAMAMRSVKLGGGGAYAHFDPAMAVDMREQAELLQALRKAVDHGELQLYYQPKVDAHSLQVTAAEALLRWQHPRLGMVLPAVFIPLAERHGLMTSIGRWVIDEACRQAAVWRERGLRMRVAINLSAQQLREDDLVDHIESTLKRHGIPPGRLTCEITETVAMEDTRVTRSAFEQLRRAGLHVSIDDFGTGHSSLATLRRLPAAELKIDRAFIAGLSGGGSACSIVKAIVEMAHSLGLRVVAEGVETAAQRDELVALGCDELQGYLFAKPMTAVALALWADDDDARGGGDGNFRPSLFEATAPASF